jgi:ribosomal protein S18 acetylase RimI-like enzyme
MLSLLMRRPDLDDLPPAPANVELATDADADSLSQLLDASFAEDWDSARVHRDLLDDKTVQATYLLREGDRIVATASARVLPEEYPGAGYLHWVASDPQLRGRGLGRAVTIAVMRHFVEDELASTVLETDDERLPAISVYLGLGYVPQYRDASHEDRWSKIFRALNDHRRPSVG